MTTSINDIAKWFLHTSAAAGDLLTHLKLQKLCYYAEAWRLAITGKPLTGEEFQAWVHGPVSPTLYREYRRHRWSTIPVPHRAPPLSRSIVEHLEEVLDAYSRFSAWDLERMTHQEEPWIKARNGCDPTDECKNPLDPGLMRSYYKRRLDGKK